MRTTDAKFIDMLAYTVAAASFCFAPGCAIDSHRTQQQAAEQHWKDVRAEVKFNHAAELLERGSVDAAVLALQEAIELDGANPSHSRLIAQCFLERGDIGAARTAINKAASLGDESADLHYMRGLIAERLGQENDALEHFAHARRLEPHRTDLLVAEAETLVALGRPHDAKASIDANLSEFDRDPRLLLLRAGVCEVTGDLEQAASDYAEARTRVADAAWATERRGLLLVRLERYREALTVLAPMLEATEPRNGESHAKPIVRAAATCYTRTGSPAKARRILEQLLRQDPKDSRACWLLAEACIQMSDWTAADRAATRGAHLSPDLPHWGLVHAFVARRRGHKASARTILETLLQSHPDDEPAKFMLANLDEPLEPRT